MLLSTRKKRLAGAMLAASLATPAQAVPFNIGALEGQLDSELTLSTRWASANAERELIGAANGGRAPAASGDDGRLNFKRGETFSKRLAGWHGLVARVVRAPKAVARNRCQEPWALRVTNHDARGGTSWAGS